MAGFMDSFLASKGGSKPAPEPDKKPGAVIAIGLGGPKPDPSQPKGQDGADDTMPNEAEVTAVRAFSSATDDVSKARALKAFIAACGYGEPDEDDSNTPSAK